MPEIYFDEAYKKRGTASRENSSRRRRASVEQDASDNKNSWKALVPPENTVHVIKDETRASVAPSRHQNIKRKNILEGSSFLGAKDDFSFDNLQSSSSLSARRRHRKSAKKRPRKDIERENTKDSGDALPDNCTGGKQRPRVTLSPTAQQQEQQRNEQGRSDNHGQPPHENDGENTLAKSSSLDSTLPSVDFILDSIRSIHKELTTLDEQSNEEQTRERKNELLSSKESLYILLDQHDSEDQVFL